MHQNVSAKWAKIKDEREVTTSHFFKENTSKREIISWYYLVSYQNINKSFIYFKFIIQVISTSHLNSEEFHWSRRRNRAKMETINRDIYGNNQNVALSHLQTQVLPYIQQTTFLTSVTKEEIIYNEQFLL